MTELKLPELKNNEYIASVYKNEHSYGAFAISKHGLIRNVFFFSSAASAENILDNHLFFFEKIEDIKYKKFLKIWEQVISSSFNCVTYKKIDIPLDSNNWTPLQGKVYDIIRNIPPGETYSYGKVAELIGKPKSARSIGKIMAINPVAPIIPCHRVIGKKGTMTGYSANGGVALKEKLLETEKTITP